MVDRCRAAKLSAEKRITERAPRLESNGNVTTLGWWVENLKEWHPANQAIPKIWEEKGECTQTCKYYDKYYHQ